MSEAIKGLEDRKKALEAVLNRDLLSLFEPLIERYKDIDFRDNQLKVSIDDLEKRRILLLKEEEEIKDKLTYGGNHF